MTRMANTTVREESAFSLLFSRVEALGPVADQERIRRIGAETLQAFEKLAAIRRAVAIVGSAQRGPLDQWGPLARETAALLARAGFAVVTGGGPGLMAAANQGARDAAGTSVGLVIDLPTQEAVNAYLTLEVPFHYFSLRKFMFVKYACAFVCFPGGFGTLDELFEALNLVRTHKLEPFPVILVGSEYWSGLRDWLTQAAVREGCLSEADLELLEVVDEPEAVLQRVRQCHELLRRKLGATS